MVNHNRIEIALIWLTGIAGLVTVVEATHGLVTTARSVHSILWALGAAIGMLLWIISFAFGIARNKTWHATAIGIIGAVTFLIMRITLGM